MSAPDVAGLTRRLAETPEDFLAPPRIGGSGAVDVAAVIADLLWAVHGSPPDVRALAASIDAGSAAETNLQRVRLVASWALHDPAFRRAELAQRMVVLLVERVPAIAALVDAELFVRDPDRREELARVILDALGMVPAGETEAQARDRLAALDSVERKRVIEASRAAEARAQAVRAAMAAKAAAEAAAKASRE